MSAHDEAGFCKGRNLRRGKTNIITYRDPKKPDRSRLTSNQQDLLQKLSLGWRLVKDRLSCGVTLSKFGERTKVLQDRIISSLVSSGLLIVSISGSRDVYTLGVSADASSNAEEE
jgi:hypothetical protein